MGTKAYVIERLFNDCKEKMNFEFDNYDVKRVSQEFKFANHFDVTKIDNKSKIPKLLIDEDYCVIHLGGGRHKFVKGINSIYHTFEPIKETVSWEYKRSLLNLYNSSESNLLSVVNNQRILHHFLFKQDSEFEDVDIFKRPKTYFPHRTKTSFSYNIGDLHISLSNIQIEIDLTIELKGVIGVFEGKNGNAADFSIYQLYHPFLYYYNAKKCETMRDKIIDIFSVYVMRLGNSIKMWSYTFERPNDMTSIKLVNSANYLLVE